jgi:ribosome-binding factor A
VVSHRIEKVQELLKRELSEIIQRDLKDPRVGFITVSRAKVSGDLRHAKIYVSVMGDEKSAKDTMEGLSSARGYIQRELGRKVKIKFLPALEFVLDTSVDHGFHIMEILKKIEEEKRDEHEDQEKDSGVDKEGQ